LPEVTGSSLLSPAETQYRESQAQERENTGPGDRVGARVDVQLQESVRDVDAVGTRLRLDPTDCARPADRARRRGLEETGASPAQGNAGEFTARRAACAEGRR